MRTIACRVNAFGGLGFWLRVCEATLAPAGRTLEVELPDRVLAFCVVFELRLRVDV